MNLVVTSYKIILFFYLYIIKFFNVKCISLIILTIFYYGFCAIFYFLSLLRIFYYLHSLFVTSRLYKLQISINDIGSRHFLSFYVIYPTTHYVFRYSSFSSFSFFLLSQSKITQGRALSCARELHLGLSSGYGDQRIDRPCRL